MLDESRRLAYSRRHLRHELLMLRWALSQTNIKDPLRQTALSEIWALHTRNLLQFLYKPAHLDDVTYKDFMEPGSIWAPPPFFDPNLLDRLHKQVAHLTSRRQSEHLPEERYDIEEIYKSLARVLRDFVDNASPKYLDKDILRPLIRAP